MSTAVAAPWEKYSSEAGPWAKYGPKQPDITTGEGMEDSAQQQAHQQSAKTGLATMTRDYPQNYHLGEHSESEMWPADMALAGASLGPAIASGGIKAVARPVMRGVLGSVAGKYLGREVGGMVGQPDIGGKIGGVAGGLYGGLGGKVPTKTSLLERVLASAPEAEATEGTAILGNAATPAPAPEIPSGNPTPFRVPLGAPKAPPNAAGEITTIGSVTNPRLLGTRGTGGLRTTPAGLLPAPGETTGAPAPEILRGNPTPFERAPLGGAPQQQSILGNPNYVPKPTINEVVNQATGVKPLQPNVPIREQLTRMPTPDVQADPLKVKYPDSVVRQVVRANGEAVVQAAEGKPETLQAIHKLTRVDLRQALINAGEDMDQMTVSNSKFAGEGSITREDAFGRLLKKGYSPDQIVDLTKSRPPQFKGGINQKGVEASNVQMSPEDTATSLSTEIGRMNAALRNSAGRPAVERAALQSQINEYRQRLDELRQAPGR